MTPTTQAAGSPSCPSSEISFSVIVPVKDGIETLAECLTALARSNHPPGEVIVVDDGSSDDSAGVARRLGARVVRLETSVGAGGARNAGAAAARHDPLCFVDADVAVQPQTLGQLASNFATEPDIDAAFGSYDSRLGKRNLASQYRNLLHHAVHQEGMREAATFWSGLGAMRKAAFESVGGFDANFEGRIEDIDLGLRLRRRGGRIVLDKAALATHLKEWTLWSMLVCDVRYRAIPWAKLILADGAVPDDLNLKQSQRVCAALACILLVLLVAGAWQSPSLLLLPIMAGVGLWAADRWTRSRPIPVWAKLSAALVGVAWVGILTQLRVFADPAGQIGLIACVFLAATIAALNRGFYRAIWERNPALLLAAFPLHLFYYLYSSLAFLVGSVSYVLSGLGRSLAARG